MIAFVNTSFYAGIEMSVVLGTAPRFVQKNRFPQ
jgi:hypothetical protein